MNLEKLLKELLGKTISKVNKVNNADCGLKIEFTDGTNLEYGYSGCEGTTTYNFEEIKELG